MKSYLLLRYHAPIADVVQGGRAVGASILNRGKRAEGGLFHGKEARLRAADCLGVRASGELSEKHNYSEISMWLALERRS